MVSLRHIVPASMRGLWPGPDQQWRRNQYTAVISLFVSFVGFSFAMPFLPLYLRQLDVQTLEEASFWSGIAFGVSPFIAAILAPFWGAFGDRFGYKFLVLRCLMAFTILLVLMGLVTHMWQLMVLRVILGFFGGFTTVATIMVMSYGPPHRVGEAVGMVQAAQIVGHGLGPVIGGVVADAAGLRPSFLAAAAMCAVATAIIFRFLEEDKRIEQRPTRGREQVPMHRVLLLANFIPLMVVLFGARFVERTFDPVMPLFVSQLDVDPGLVASAVGVIIGLSTVGRTVSSVLADGWARRWSPKGLVVAALVASALSCLPMALATSYWQMLLLRGLEGFLSGGLTTLAITLGSQAVPKDQRGAGVGTLMSAGMYGSAISAPFGGALGAVSLRLVFLADAAIFGVLTLYTVAFLKGEALARPASAEARVQEGGSSEEHT